MSRASQPEVPLHRQVTEDHLHSCTACQFICDHRGGCVRSLGICGEMTQHPLCGMFFALCSLRFVQETRDEACVCSDSRVVY